MISLLKRIFLSLFNRTKVAICAFLYPAKNGYFVPAWLNGRETFDLDKETITGIFRNLYEYEITASEREWKQLMFYFEMANLIEDVPGDYAEFGVSGGVSLIAIARILSIGDRGLDNKEKRRIYGFDSFEGLPDLHQHDDAKSANNAHMLRGGFVDNQGYKHLQKFVESADNIELVKGWFNESLPVFLKDKPATSFAMLHIDCDLYDSTKDVLELAWDHLTPGGVIIFDELYHKDFPGETKAFREFFDKRQGAFKIKKSKIKPDKKYIIKK